MMNEYETKLIMSHDLGGYTQQIIEHAVEGWFMDNQNYPMMKGWLYTGGLKRALANSSPKSTLEPVSTPSATITPPKPQTTLKTTVKPTKAAIKPPAKA